MTAWRSSGSPLAARVPDRPRRGWKGPHRGSFPRVRPTRCSRGSAIAGRADAVRSAVGWNVRAPNAVRPNRRSGRVLRPAGWCFRRSLWLFLPFGSPHAFQCGAWLVVRRVGRCRIRVREHVGELFRFFVASHVRFVRQAVAVERARPGVQRCGWTPLVRRRSSGSFLLRVGMVLAVSGVFSSSSVPVLSSRMMSVSFHIPIPGPVAGMAPWSMPGSGSGRAFASGKAEAQGSPTCAGWVWLTASGMVVVE